MRSLPKDKNAGSQEQTTWLDHVYTSGQILLLILACFIILFSILAAGFESGTLVGTLVSVAWLFLSIGWWIVYRLLCYALPSESRARTP